MRLAQTVATSDDVGVVGSAAYTTLYDVSYEYTIIQGVVTPGSIRSIELVDVYALVVDSEASISKGC